MAEKWCVSFAGEDRLSGVGGKGFGRHDAARRTANPNSSGLYAAHQREVWAAAFSRFMDAESAMDVAQEAFLRLMAALGGRMARKSPTPAVGSSGWPGTWPRITRRVRSGVTGHRLRISWPIMGDRERVAGR